MGRRGRDGETNFRISIVILSTNGGTLTWWWPGHDQVRVNSDSRTCDARPCDARTCDARTCDARTCDSRIDVVGSGVRSWLAGRHMRPRADRFGTVVALVKTKNVRRDRPSDRTVCEVRHVDDPGTTVESPLRTWFRSFELSGRQDIPDRSGRVVRRVDPASEHPADHGLR
jgi:hypothetical protein